MRVTSVGSTDGIGLDTVFTFQQAGSTVWAAYSGGNIVQGFLIGTVTGALLHFDYLQVTRSGRRDTGKSRCTLTQSTETGLLRLTEEFEWSSRAGNGVNTLEEILE
jgi:hypothetical protein